MALTDNGNGLSAADVAAVVGNNGGAFGNGFWGDGSFWIIICSCLPSWAMVGADLEVTPV